MFFDQPVTNIFQLLGIVAGFLAGTVLPGYLILAAFESFRRQLPPLTRLSVAIIFGLCVNVILGTTLLSLGLKLPGWFYPGVPLLLSLVVFAAGRLLTSRFGDTKPVPFKPSGHASNWLQAALYLSIVCLGIFAGLWFAPAASADGKSSLTEFYILIDGKLPTSLVVDRAGELSTSLVITSHEATTAQYNIAVYSDGEAVDTFKDISLAPGQTWSVNWMIAETRLLGEKPASRLRFDLYKDGQLYRQLMLNLTRSHAVQVHQ
jgi:uncharacterized membrane protein